MFLQNSLYFYIPFKNKNVFLRLLFQIWNGFCHTQQPKISPSFVKGLILCTLEFYVKVIIYFDFSGKIDVPIEQRLIECEKALLNTLELSISIPTNFMTNPEVNAKSMEILSHMHSYIMDANFRQILIPTLPPLITSEPRHNSDSSTSKQENDSTEIDVKNGGDQESDGDSVRKFPLLLFSIKFLFSHSQPSPFLISKTAMQQQTKEKTISWPKNMLPFLFMAFSDVFTSGVCWLCKNAKNVTKNRNQIRKFPLFFLANDDILPTNNFTKSA